MQVIAAPVRWNGHIEGDRPAPLGFQRVTAWSCGHLHETTEDALTCAQAEVDRRFPDAPPLVAPEPEPAPPADPVAEPPAAV